MRLFLRRLSDRAFTFLSLGSIVLLSFVLVLILGPMIWRGAGAVFFNGTVEFRKMQLAQFGRGDVESISEEDKEAEAVRARAYEILDSFAAGIDVSGLEDEVKDLYREYGKMLRAEGVDKSEYLRLRGLAKDLRKELEAAFETSDEDEAFERLNAVLGAEEGKVFEGTLIEGYFQIARDYKLVLDQMDLGKRSQYETALAEVTLAFERLFGPRPGEELPPLAQNRYGATRMDVAYRELDNLLYAEEWVSQGEGKRLVKKRIRREEQFAGTSLEPLFGYVEENLEASLLPRFTFYIHYFIDDSTPGHFFGGVGPETVGTLMLTFLAILFAVPLGITSAAFLVECTKENLAVKVIRMCVNTLAGVPSIVFGLFGLAFFVMYVMPMLGRDGEGSVLTASLTLAILILPVIIRASEEAIRSVPATYREASLALGASSFRTFMKVTLPAALPGILTGIILSLGRAAGETAPILFTGAVAFGPVAKSIFDPTRVLSYGSYDIAVGDRLAMRVPHNQYGMIMTLIVLVLLMNITAIVIRSKISRNLRGG